MADFDRLESVIDAIRDGLKDSILECLEEKRDIITMCVTEQLYSGIDGEGEYLSPTYDNDPYFNEKGRATYFISEISDRTQIDDYNGKYRKLNKGNTPETSIAAEIFNERYLRQAPGAIFICEGIFDALSVEEAGGNAIAIMGTGQKRLLSLT